LLDSPSRFLHPGRWFFVWVRNSSLNTLVKVFSGNANLPLASAIAKSIGIPLGKCTVSAFPDGETFIKIDENVRGEDVFVVQSTSPPTNHSLMELFIMMDALRRASAFRITAVLPFYGYARQDRKDQPRVPITAKLVANLLVAAGANRVLTVDLHAQQIQGFFDIPVDHLYAAPVMYDYLKKKNLPDLVVVSPDVGGLKMAHAYAQVLEAGLAIVAKRRKSATEVESLAIIGEVRGKNVLMVDDLTETAGTLTQAAELVHRRGAKQILACVSHALLNDMGIGRLRKSKIDELITTDTVLRPAIEGIRITTLSVAGLLGEAIQRIHNSALPSKAYALRPFPWRVCWAKRSSEFTRICRSHRCLRLVAHAPVNPGSGPLIFFDMKTVTLTAYPRVARRRGAVKQLRVQGRIPAIVYGRGTEPEKLEIKSKEMEDLIHHSVSETLLVDLAVNDSPRPKRLALVKEIQHHPLNRGILHVDLQEISHDQKVTVWVPVESVGEAEGVKTGGGVLEHVVFRVKVRALPKDLPEMIEVDVAHLKIGESIHIGDIKPPAGVEVLGEKTSSVLRVAAPLTEEQEAALTAAEAATSVADVEMIKEKKEEGEAAPAAGAAAAGKAPAGKAPAGKAPAEAAAKPGDKAAAAKPAAEKGAEKKKEKSK
jgi:ribose-phosphate pyrophosphokinase